MERLYNQCREYIVISYISSESELQKRPWTFLLRVVCGYSASVSPGRGRSGSVSCIVTVPFPWVLVHIRFYVMSSNSGIFVSPQFYGSSVIKSPWTSKSDSLGSSVPLPDAQAEKPDVGPRTSTTMWELLWYYCSAVSGSPTWWVWDLISSWLHPSYCLMAPPLSLNAGYRFWWVPVFSCWWLFCGAAELFDVFWLIDI